MKIHLYLAVVLIISLAILFLSDFEPFLLFTLILIITALVIGSRYMMAAYKKREIAKEEWQESVAEGGIEEPQLFRDLTDEERKTLEKQHRWSKLILNNLWWLIPLFIIFDVFLGISFFRYWGDYASYHTAKLVAEVSAFALIIEAQLIKLATDERIRYSDLRSPVFRVQGKVIKEKYARRSGTDYYVTVRRIKFSNTNYPDLPRMFNDLKDGDEVAVEYSPRTRHVWKMYKTEDLKQNPT